jgi:hypothetical protein
MPGSRRQVMNGTVAKTSGGLAKDDLKKNKAGKIVSKKSSQASSKRYAKNDKLKAWNALVMSVYKKMGGKGAKSLSAAMKEASRLRKSGKTSA